MSYQEAAATRKKSFISTLTDKLVEGEGIGSSIKSTISEKSKAKAKGLKEKVDPMNIIKFMTGGSKLAAALYGNARGRSKEDMKYFTGATGTSSAKEVGGTATKIDSLEKDNEVVSMLLKIYDFMKTTSGEDKLRKEEEDNRKEEIDYEKGLRHKALLEALTGLKSGKTVTATKEKSEDDFGGIFASLLAFVKDLIEKAVKSVMDIVNGIKETVLGLLNAFGALKNLGLITNLMKFAGSPIGIAFLAAAAGGLLARYLLNLAEEDKKENPEAWKDTPIARAERENTTKGVAGQRNRAESVKGFRAPEIAESLNTKPAFTDDELIAQYGRPRKELQNWVSMNPNGFLKKNDFVPEPTPTSQAEAQDLENGASQQPMPVPSTPKTNELNEKTKEMNDIKLPKQPPISKSETVNTTNVIGEKKMNPTGPLPSVRNQEPTFANMILYSTRVV